MLIPEVKIFSISTFSDERGGMSFCNDFDFSLFKRYYIITPKYEGQIRAWQGHQREEKVFLILEGKIKLVVVPLIDLNSNHFGDPHEFILDSKDPKLIHLPGGYANGFQFLDMNSKLMVFSNFSLEESRNDEYRFDPKEFFDWNQ